MFKFFKSAPVVATPPPTESRSSIFTTHESDTTPRAQQFTELATTLKTVVSRLKSALPVPLPNKDGGVVAMDSSDSGNIDNAFAFSGATSSPAITGWYASQSFIGYQMCSLIAQHWLVDKACSMPARDAMRKGFTIESDKGDLTPEDLAVIKHYDRKFQLMYKTEQFLRKGRIFGIRVAIFKIAGASDEFYEQPFDINLVQEGAYEGIVQVDPYWCIPQLSASAVGDPDSLDFYAPTWWTIKGKKYHRSHVCVFINSEVTDIIKPSYLYGGVSIPQQVFERVYAAERTANEAPMLAMTKRTTVLKVDLAQAYANKTEFDANLSNWIAYRDNYQVKLAGLDDEVTQLDTSLTDLDALIMTQYQLVASIAGVPATKLLGTTPKGFNATGDYEAGSYREELESLQACGATPLIERHHQLVIKSFLKNPTLQVVAVWNPVDSPTATEHADINLKKAQTAQVSIDSGAIDAYEERERLTKDPHSGYSGLEAVTRPADNETDA